MLNGNLRSQIDQLWLEFHTGGITNPLTVIEQISYLMFARMLDIMESRNEKKYARMEAQGETTPFTGIFPPDKQKIRWSNFQKRGADEMFLIVRDELFPFFKEMIVEKNTLGHFLKDAQFLIPKSSLLVTAVNRIDSLPLLEGDTKGDLYEYLLSKLSTAGINGQFRTPRHIIRAMVEMIDPDPRQALCDPACGTGGFLVGAMEYLKEKYTSPAGILEEKDDQGNRYKIYLGDLLEPYRDPIQKQLLHGFDFDITMLRIASMNLLLHGIESPNIHYQDSLANTFGEHFPTKASDAFDIILANPPFTGSLDAANVDSTVKSMVKTKKTELLFLALILRMLKTGGRCAVIVPDGVLFGSSKAHQDIRQILLENNQLEAVISLPSGVFKPYAGVSTAILLFTKGGKSDRVWFYKVEADGFSLDDKRAPVAENDLPDLLHQWKTRDPQKSTDRKGKSFFIPAQDIIANKYDLSLNRYKETAYEEVEYEAPKVILERLRKLEGEIGKDLAELEEFLK